MLGGHDTTLHSKTTLVLVPGYFMPVDDAADDLDYLQFYNNAIYEVRAKKDTFVRVYKLTKNTTTANNNNNNNNKKVFGGDEGTRPALHGNRSERAFV